jgi:general L-amino acid transport system permease protein
VDVAAIPRAARPPFWRDVRVLRVLGQVVFVLALFLVLREMLLNLTFQIRRQGLDLSFDFLQQRAGFSIKEHTISYSPNQTFLRAYVVGVVNTIRVAAVGIVLATVLGLIMGVARLSPNWLVRKIAQIYVEAIRNTPVLIQIIFLYVGVVLALPAIEGGLSLGGAFLSNRGAAIPWLRAEEGLGTWFGFLGSGLLLAAAAWVWRTRTNERTGRPHHRLAVAALVVLVVASVGFVLAGSPLRLDVPELEGTRYAGGFQVSPEYAALLIALVVYTGAFVAEIVRGSILAVSKGQKEAAEALGFTPFQQLRFVVLPQAMRIAIPPLNSQYLNLTKNSSLAIAIAYPELVSISRTIANQAGRATQILLIVMSTYLAMSLSISLVMNLLNRAVTRRGER